MSEHLPLSRKETPTDPKQELEEYSSIFIEYNAAKFDFSREVMERLTSKAKNDIIKNPEVHGWVKGKNELVLTTVTSDNYLFNMVATRVILENISLTSSDSLKKIIAWGGIQNYLKDLSVACAPNFPPESLMEILDWVSVQ